MLTERQIKERLFAAAVDGIRKTAFNDGLHVEVMGTDNKTKTEVVVRCKVDGRIASYVLVKVSNMIG